MIRGNFESFSKEELNDTKTSDAVCLLIDSVDEKVKEDQALWTKWLEENKEAFDEAQKKDSDNMRLRSSLSFRRDCLEKGFVLEKMYALYYQGWECDEWGAIGTKDGKTYVLETNHGSLYPREIDPMLIKVVSIATLELPQSETE